MTSSDVAILPEFPGENFFSHAATAYREQVEARLAELGWLAAAQGLQSLTTLTNLTTMNKAPKACQTPQTTNGETQKTSQTSKTRVKTQTRYHGKRHTRPLSWTSYDLRRNSYALSSYS